MWNPVARKPQAQVQKNIRGGRAVRALARRAKVAQFSEKAALEFGAGIMTGLGLGHVIEGKAGRGALLSAAGVGTYFAFDALGSRMQRTLAASMLGRPKLTDAVCNRIHQPELERGLRSLGSIFLPRSELVKLRRYALSRRGFDFTNFLAETRVLRELGQLRAQHKNLTSEAVNLSLGVHGTQLAWPLQPRAQRAMEFAEKLVKQVVGEPPHLEAIQFKTLRSITTQVFGKHGISPKVAADVVLDLGRRATRYREKPSVKSFESDELLQYGFKIRVAKVIGNKGWEGGVIVEFHPAHK